MKTFSFRNFPFVKGTSSSVLSLTDSFFLVLSLAFADLRRGGESQKKITRHLADLKMPRHFFFKKMNMVLLECYVDILK